MNMMNRNRQMRGRIEDMNPIREMRAHVHVSLRYMMNRNRQVRGHFHCIGGVFNVHDEPESPNEMAYFLIDDGSESRNEGD